MIPSEQSINDFCASAILRAIRSRHTVPAGGFESPKLDLEKDIDGLRFYWALSSPVADLVRFLVEHVRSPLTRVDFEERETYGSIPGVLLTTQSVIEQARRADPCVFLVEEPSPTLNWAANHLVAWTVREALHTLLSGQRRFQLGEEYEWLHARTQAADSAVRGQAIRDILLSVDATRRPGSNAQRACARSKSVLYRLALEAFLLLNSLEAGSAEAVLTILRSSILPALAVWRRFELSTILAAIGAISTATGSAIYLRMPFRGGQTVASVSDFEIRWQYALPRRTYALLDPTERLANDLMTSLGISDGTDICDIAIIFRPENRVVGILECKWFESEDAVSGAIREATSQVARYARDLHPADEVLASELAARSVIAVASLGPINDAIDGTKSIYLTGFEGLKNRDLAQWATDIVNSVAEPIIVAA